MKKGLKTMNEKTMGAIPVSALERLEQSAVKLSLITFCLRHEELKAAPDAAEMLIIWPSGWMQHGSAVSVRSGRRASHGSGKCLTT